MIRQISTLIVVIVVLGIITFFIQPAFYAFYNRMSELGTLPSTSSYTLLNNYVSFLINNLPWIVVMLTIVIFYIYISTKSNAPYE